MESTMNLRLMFLTSGFLTATVLGACSRDEFAPWGFPQDLQFNCKDVPSSLPLLVVGQTWEWDLMPKGGKGPLMWSDPTNSLPPGLMIDDNGVISGTPTTAGSYPVTLSVTDADGNTTTYDCATLMVNEPDAPQIDCIAEPSDSILDGFVGIPYVFEVTAPGGAVPYTWAVQGLPPGLSLVPDATDTTKATISGTPTTKGPYSVDITVTDANGVETMINCGDLLINDPISVDTPGLLAAFPDGCVPLGVGLQELLNKKVLVGGDSTPIACELRIGRGMGSSKFDNVTETMPPGITLDNASCTPGGTVSPSLPFGIYGFITTFTQSGLDAFVPYCAPQMVQAPTAYEVKREDMGALASFKPGLQVLDFVANGPVDYGTAVPDPKVTVTDDVGACPANTCFYAFVYKFNTLSGNATVSASPNSKFPAMGFDGFTHALQVDDADPSLFTRFAKRPFVANIQFDYCIADNGDDCGNTQPATPEGSAMRATLVRQNGGSSNYYFSLVVLPK